jgi:hypothetical protein
VFDGPDAVAAAWTTPVAGEVAEEVPFWLDAVTAKRSVAPASLAERAYVVAVAPSIGPHALPAESQRSH